MIKANELRIENYVNDVAGFPFKVAAMCLVALAQCEAAKKVNMGYNPIPLTEDWLIKLGFENSNTWFKKGDIELSPEFNYCIYDVHGDYVGGIKIEYIHQLQNLYFSLTGQELTIK